MSGREALFPNYAPYPLRPVRGAGSRVWGEDGRAYIDLMTGVAVTSLGHAPKAVIEAVTAQLHQLWHISNWYDIPQQQVYAAQVTAACCADVAFFCNSGAEANEAAIKLARRYTQYVRGATDRIEIVTFAQSFHGRTIATLTATGQDKVKTGFYPLVPGFVHVPYNDCEALRAVIGQQTCAILLEWVQGEGGVTVASDAFADTIRSLCAEHDVLLISDEIQTGMGRTGRLFAYEHWGIEPDIITVAKGIASGFPMGMMLAKQYLAEAFTVGTHGSTFGGNPLACVAAQATWDTIMKEQLIDRAHTLGSWALRFLHERLQTCPDVVDIRGRGMMIGIQLSVPVSSIIERCLERGVLVIGAGTHVLRLLPALNIPESLWQEGLEHVIDAICGR